MSNASGVLGSDRAAKREQVPEGRLQFAAVQREANGACCILNGPYYSLLYLLDTLVIKSVAQAVAAL